MRFCDTKDINTIRFNVLYLSLYYIVQIDSRLCPVIDHNPKNINPKENAEANDMIQ